MSFPTSEVAKFKGTAAPSNGSGLDSQRVANSGAQGSRLRKAQPRRRLLQAGACFAKGPFWNFV